MFVHRYVHSIVRNGTPERHWGGMTTELVPIGNWESQGVYYGGRAIPKEREYPGRDGASAEEWLDDLELVPTAEGKGFHVGLRFRDAAKRQVSGDRIVEWVGLL